MRQKTAFFYILGQIIPTFILGIVVFVFILLMFQFLKLTEFILVFNVSIPIVAELLLNVMIGFLPIILPMSLLFAILLTYSRLSSDSEMVAFKALGYSPFFLSVPAVLFSMFICLISSQTLFKLGPMARLKRDVIIGQIGNQKVMSTIEEGTFSESFFDLVLYTNHIDKEKNLMTDLFIFDRRNPKSPLAIVAQEGRISTGATKDNQLASILLTTGDMYKLGEDSHTKVKFKEYELKISSPIATLASEKDADALTLSELEARLENPPANLPKEKYVELASEYHGRWAIAVSCLLFGFLGSSLGSQTNRRSSASSGFIISVICIISYWILYVLANSTAKKMILSPTLSLWIPNILFLLVTIWAWRRHSRA